MRLIDADALYKEFENGYNDSHCKSLMGGDYWCGHEDGIDWGLGKIDRAPTVADVAPIRQGHWDQMCYHGGILDGTENDKCSVCGFERVVSDRRLKVRFNYCPNCGAKMVEEVEA